MKDKNSLCHGSFNTPIFLGLERPNSFEVNLKKYIQQILAEARIQIHGSHPWDLQVHNENLYRRVITKGSLGLGEAYIEGWWDCERLDEFFARILRAKLHKLYVNHSLEYLLETTKAKFWNLQSFSRSFK